MIELNETQQALLNGDHGVAKQMAMRLVLDMAAAAGATELVKIDSAHLSGVSPLTGGLGLRQFLAKLASDERAQVAVPTTLNSAGCDEAQFDDMDIVAPDFLAHNHEIVSLYSQIGVRPTQSCIPYEWDGVTTEGVAAWAESNAICFGNTYCDLVTNRESGLSALAAALTGYTPKYGLLVEGADACNLVVWVSAELNDATDYSLLGDWIGTQRQPHWKMPLGPIPQLYNLPADMSHEQRKALTAAAANYGIAKLEIVDGALPADLPESIQDKLEFSAETLSQRYADLAPKTQPSLIVLGCPQASVGELRDIATLLKGKRVAPNPNHDGSPYLWVFTSEHNRGIAEQTGIADTIREAGALLLADTCPEVVPYNRAWVRHILTNSMKAEHYIKSGLNGIPTSVVNLPDCIAFATGERAIEAVAGEIRPKAKKKPKPLRQAHGAGRQQAVFNGSGLPSQEDFSVTGEAFVTSAPITLLGFVNRETGVIEEPGHPADGESMAGKIAIFPKGSGSTVAPYVLLELFYRGMAPIAIANTDIDQQSAPACSLENIPYGHSFDGDIIAGIQSGDTVEMVRRDGVVSVRRVESRE